MCVHVCLCSVAMDLEHLQSRSSDDFLPLGDSQNQPCLQEKAKGCGNNKVGAWESNKSLV